LSARRARAIRIFDSQRSKSKGQSTRLSKMRTAAPESMSYRFSLDICQAANNLRGKIARMLPCCIRSAGLLSLPSGNSNPGHGPQIAMPRAAREDLDSGGPHRHRGNMSRYSSGRSYYTAVSNEYKGRRRLSAIDRGWAVRGNTAAIARHIQSSRIRPVMRLLGQRDQFLPHRAGPPS
jgi:hypothetical protein